MLLFFFELFLRENIYKNSSFIAFRAVCRWPSLLGEGRDEVLRAVSGKSPCGGLRGLL